MHPDIPAQSLAAIATVVVALIAAAFSFVNLTLNKEQKTSEFRQAWIDGLREDLAAFFAGVRAFARATEELKSAASASRTAQPLAMTPEKISDIRYQAAERRYRIQLRLNLKEPEHKELLRLMQMAVDEQNKFLADKSDVARTLQAIENAADYAPQILKAEWERVKRGELAFRLARNWIAPAIVLISLLFVALVWVGRVKI